MTSTLRNEEDMTTLTHFNVDRQPTEYHQRNLQLPDELSANMNGFRSASQYVPPVSVNAQHAMTTPFASSSTEGGQTFDM
jgi:hypothetical protein